MNVLLSAFAALVIVSPKDGEVVPTLRDGQKAYFSGNRAERFLRIDNPSDRLRLLAMGATQKALRLEWSGGTNGSYVVSISPDGGKEETFELKGRTFAYLTNLELGKTYRWMVRETGSGDFAHASFETERQPPRLLRADGVGNFRDLGGWMTDSGKRVKQNMIFRSAGLRENSLISNGFRGNRVEPGAQRASEEGLATLREDFGIRTDLELRALQETAGMEGSLLGDGVQWQRIPFAAYDFVGNAERGREPFARIFRILAKAESYPVLMHCSSGRDRTGTLAFLLNGLLGVSEEDLFRDWESSVFSDNGSSFRSDRIRRLTDYLMTFSGKTLGARIEAYAKDCGITDGEIAAFRALMLE